MSVRRMSQRRVAVMAAAAGLLLAIPALSGCGGDSGLTSAAWHGSAVRPSAATAAASPTPASPSPTPFAGTSSPVTADTVAHTWHAGCPVGPSQLRLLTMTYWGFDNRPHVGTMVVNSAVVPDVLKVFRSLYEQRFPIRRMQPEDAYGGSDPASMSADNTSGFNCRNAVAAGKPSWSVHAYGEAIDVNTVENPYIFQGKAQPASGAAYANRSNVRPGMAVKGGVLVQAFAAVGWQWGGRWSGAPDYQHFSKTGG